MLPVGLWLFLKTKYLLNVQYLIFTLTFFIISTIKATKTVFFVLEKAWTISVIQDAQNDMQLL